MEKIKSYIILALFVFILVLSGCSSNNQIKRAKKLIAKAELNGAKWTVDSVFIEKTIVTKEVKTDTLFKDVIGDTVYIVKDKLKIKYVRTPGDTIFIEAKAEKDTVKVIVPVTVTKVLQPAKTWMNRWWIFLLVGFAVGIIIALWLRK